MKILMLTPYLPYPPASGGQIRTLNLLNYLKNNHEVTLVSLYKNNNEKRYASHLESYCDEIFLCKRAEKPWQLKNILSSVFSFLPFLIVRNYSKEAKDVVEKLLKNEKFDVIHAETFYIMPHIPPTDIPILLVEQTIEFKVYQHFISSLFLPIRLVLKIDILKLIYWEKYYWKRASLVATMSESDKVIIESIDSSIKPVIIPNGAGDEMFIDKLPKKDSKNPSLLFVGNFYWLQNTEAATYIIERLYPILKKVVPNIRLIIAGQNAKKIQASDKGIDIVDIKPDDSSKIKEFYRKAYLFIAPIIGPGGTRLKVLASMASGVPIISTKTGVEGLGVENGKHVAIADSSDEMVDAVNRLINDKEFYGRLQKNAHALAKDNFSWSSISKKLENVYEDIICE